jgi:hypothetical protein
MARVDVSISCTGNGDVDLRAIQREIAGLIKSLTGQSCQVILNTTSTSGISERVKAFQMAQSMDKGSIEGINEI